MFSSSVYTVIPSEYFSNGKQFLSSPGLVWSGIRWISRGTWSNAARIGPSPRRYVKRSHGRTVHGLHTGKGSFRRLFTVLSSVPRGRTATKWKVEEKGRGKGARASERASERVQGRMRAWAKRRMLDSRPQEASIRAETCAGECRCRDADARTLIWLRVTWNELAWCRGNERKRDGEWEGRGEKGGRPVREREEEDRIRLVDKTGGEIGCGGTERADLAQARRKKKSLARTPRRSPLTRHHAAPCTWCYWQGKAEQRASRGPCRDHERKTSTFEKGPCRSRVTGPRLFSGTSVEIRREPARARARSAMYER